MSEMGIETDRIKDMQAVAACKVVKKQPKGLLSFKKIDEGSCRVKLYLLMEEPESSFQAQGLSVIMAASIILSVAILVAESLFIREKDSSASKEDPAKATFRTIEVFFTLL